jgi:hypothetical protein
MCELCVYYVLVCLPPGNRVRVVEFLGSHGGEHEDGSLPSRCVTLSGRSLSTFLECLLPPSSGPCCWQTTRCNNPEDNHLQGSGSCKISVMFPVYVCKFCYNF